MRNSSNSQEQSHERSLRHWLPNTSLTALRQEMTDLMESFFGESQLGWKGDMQPRVDVSETPSAVEITVDAPGYQRDQIQLEVDEKSLTICGTKSEETKEEDEDRKFHRVERRTGSFSRTIWLPCPVDDSKIEACLKNGTLKIVLPKVEISRRRKVEIKEADQAPPQAAS